MLLPFLHTNVMGRRILVALPPQEGRMCYHGATRDNRKADCFTLSACSPQTINVAGGAVR
jgi:hypothetical protein